MAERYPPTDPRRLVQAADRITEVLMTEFDDLNPASTVFVLSQLLWTHHDAFSIAMKFNRR
jgi:hypothetical protein